MTVTEMNRSFLLVFLLPCRMSSPSFPRGTAFGSWGLNAFADVLGTSGVAEFRTDWFLERLIMVHTPCLM